MINMTCDMSCLRSWESSGRPTSTTTRRRRRRRVTKPGLDNVATPCPKHPSRYDSVGAEVISSRDSRCDARHDLLRDRGTGTSRRVSEIRTRSQPQFRPSEATTHPDRFQLRCFRQDRERGHVHEDRLPRRACWRTANGSRGAPPSASDDAQPPRALSTGACLRRSRPPPPALQAPPPPGGPRLRCSPPRRRTGAEPRGAATSRIYSCTRSAPGRATWRTRFPAP